MVSFNEVIRRAMEGPPCTDRDFNMKVFVPALREIIREQRIAWNPQTVVNCDDELADRVFEAGLKLYERVGTFCVDTGRIIRFTEAGIRTALAEAPSSPIFGEGKEAKPLRAREPESEDPPWCFLGACGAAVSSEAVFEAVVRGYGAIAWMDSLTAPSLASLDGVPVRAGSPLEILACIKSVVLAREALREAGRPGMPIMNCIATAVSDAGKIAGSAFGLRPSDGWLIGGSAEFKIGFERLNEIAYVIALGGRVVAETTPILGGYCGGVEGTAVSAAAYHLQSILVQRGSCQDADPIHVLYGSSASRMSIAAASLYTQAICRNSHFPLLNICNISAGPQTDMEFQETAARVIASVVSGGSIESPGGAKNARVDHVSPMLARWTAEVAHAAKGLSRQAADGIVADLLARYESRLEAPPAGSRFQDCFDLERLQPADTYLSMYERARAELSGAGLKFNR